MPSDWYDELVKDQSDGAFKGSERQELRAELYLRRMSRIFRKRAMYWLTYLGPTVAIAVGLSQFTAIANLIRKIFGNGVGP